MDAPVPIETSSWRRRELFEHYQEAPGTFMITVELDATEFVAAMHTTARKTYLAQIWALGSIVNQRDEFRLCVTETGQPAVWPVSHPRFTIFNTDNETFSLIWAPWNPDYQVFHDQAEEILDKYQHATELFPQHDLPDNTFGVSGLTWTSFTGLFLNFRDVWTHLSPMFIVGRYASREDRTYLPFALQMHHAAADGFHASRLITEFQELLTNPTWVR